MMASLLSVSVLVLVACLLLAASPVTEGFDAAFVREVCQVSSTHQESHRPLVDLINASATFTSSEVLVITAVTADILSSYASSAIAINACYARARGYAFLVFADGAYPGLDPDPRWNKVRYLLDLLHHPACPAYLLWLDADLILLDDSLDIIAIADAHAEADIIMSQDKPTAGFAGNTGTVLVRNTAWSKAFLQDWWTAYDRTKCCDQHALTWLHHARNRDGKLAFLPAAQLNSAFPAWSTFDSSSQVLHLAGMSSLYRHAVFSSALSSLCQQHEQVRQLGMSRAHLQSTLCMMDAMRLEALTTINTVLKHGADMNKVMSVRKQMLDVMKREEEEASICPLTTASHSIALQLADVLQENMQMVFHALHAHAMSSLSVSGVNLSGAVEAISAGYELILATQPPSDSSSAVLDGLLQVIHMVLQEQSLSTAALGRFLYYKFKHHQLSADLCPGNTIGSASCRIRWLEAAADAWTDMVSRTGFHGTDYASAEPNKEYIAVLVMLGSLLCSDCKHAQGLMHLDQALLLQKDSIASFAVLHLATSDGLQAVQLLHAEMLYNAGMCAATAAAEHGSANIGEGYLTQALQICQDIGAAELGDLVRKAAAASETPQTIPSQQQQVEVDARTAEHKRFRRKKRS